MDSTFNRDDDPSFSKMGSSYIDGKVLNKTSGDPDTTLNDRDKTINLQVSNGSALNSEFLTVERTTQDEYEDEVASMHNITVPAKDL